MPRGCLLPCPHESGPPHTAPALCWRGRTPAPGALVRRPTSAPRLVAEAFITARAVIGAFWLAWVALWLIEQRW